MSQPKVTNGYPDVDSITIEASDGTEVVVSRLEDGEIIINVSYKDNYKTTHCTIYTLGEPSQHTQHRVGGNI